MKKNYLINYQGASASICTLGAELKEFKLNGTNYIHDSFDFW